MGIPARGGGKIASAGAAFTMAEILLSLTIIGVVAAITLPSLTGNINERTWNTQRKALYARISQAISLMPALNGYGKYSGVNTDGVVSATEDTAAEAFVTEGLSKVMKINNVCDADHLADCGIVSSYTNLAGSKNSWPNKLSELNSMFTSTYARSNDAGSYNYYRNPQNNIDTKAAAFETQNGESIAVYYNPNCTADNEGNTWHYSQPKMCANFIYDLNGNKGPNTVGKDIGFVTALYPSDTVVVAPVPLMRNATSSYAEPVLGHGGAIVACKGLDKESRLPNRDELSSLFYNRDFIGLPFNETTEGYWSSSRVSSDKAWAVVFLMGNRFPYSRGNAYGVRCIKR